MKRYLILILIFSAMILPSFAQNDESDTSTLTAEEISSRMIELIKSIKNKEDITPESVERVMKIKVKFDEKKLQSYGFGGNIKGTSKWGYNLSAYSYPGKEKQETDSLNFSFNPLIDEESVKRDDYVPVCAVDFDAYSKELIDAGYSSVPYYGEHNRLLWWNFSRGTVSVQITAYGESEKQPNHQCVNMLVINVGNGTAKDVGKTVENKAASIVQSQTIEVFDGRAGNVKNTKTSTAETAIIENEVRIKAKEDFLKKRLKGLAENIDWETEFSVDGIAEGSFTKPNSKQKAVLYRFSYSNGIVILENEKIVAHYSGGPGDYAFYFAIKSLPDVNQNGLSEIILFRNIEDNEDVLAYLFESDKSAMNFLGETPYFNSSYIAGDETNSENAKQNAFRITIKPSANPTYLREVYERTGSKAKWILTKKSEKFVWKKKGENDLIKI